MIKVFISYSHKDEDWKDRVVTHLKALVHQGDIVLWDDRKIGTGADWFAEIESAMADASIAICLISAHYLASDFINKEEIPALKKRLQDEGMLLLPILVRPCPWQAIKWLKVIQMFPEDGVSLEEIQPEVEQEKKIADFALEVHERIESEDFRQAVTTPEWPELEENYLDIGRLPQTGKDLFGRKDELDLLDEAWTSEKTNIVSFVAWGGVGKSALVNKWIDLMKEDNYRGAQRVYAWSFYSQGTGRSVASADVFVNEALHWFGDSKMADSKRSPWDKGKRLAELVQEQKTLLILDGMEPLQSAYEHDKGEVRDAALGVLIRELSKKNCGLCVITTREDVKGVRRGADYILHKNLDQISAEAGRALLRVGGIRGTDAELEQATRDFGCHALAINLLVAYLQNTSDRHIRNAALIPDLDIPEKDGKHPRRVMEVLTINLGKSPELNVLHIIGLFDRPASAKEINWLRRQEEVPDLTDRIRWLNDDEWNRIIANLRHLRLIAPESHHNLGGLDAHPHVREHFGQKLKATNEKSFKLGHSHLYDYLKMSAPPLPENLEEMRPLFLAVSHGCQAGRHQETLNDVYYSRIQRGGSNNYCCAQLGAFGADLAAVSCFFEKPWSKPSTTLVVKDEPVLLNWVGFRLRALGLLTEAVEPMKASLELFVEQEGWGEAALNAGSLSQTYLALGWVKEAVDYARKSLEYAERSKGLRALCYGYTDSANAMHAVGNLKKSEGYFLRLESIQKEQQPDYVYVYGAQGYHFCNLLLSIGQYKEVQERARQTLEWAKQYVGKGLALWDISLDKLSLGRAYLLKSVAEKSGNFTKANDFLNQAVDGLREAGQQQLIPLGLLARAEMYQYQREFEKAWADLEEAAEIAERGEMNLWLADYHLEAARLCLAEGKKEKEAREHWKEAKDRVEKMGYHRRNPEVMLIETELELAEGNKEAAGKKLDEAKECIDKMGFHRWDVEVERLAAKVK